MDNTQSQNRPPADVIRDGALKATIWENQSEKGAYFTTTLAKTYEDRNGQLRDTHSLSGNDLLRGSELLRQAYTRANELRRELNPAQRQGHGGSTGHNRSARQEAFEESRQPGNRSREAAPRLKDQYRDRTP